MSTTTSFQIDNAYWLGLSKSTQYYHAQVVSCPADAPLIATGAVNPDEPVVLQIDKGSRASDFIWNSHNLVVASYRVIDALRRNQVSGWRTYKVDVLMKDGTSMSQGYTGVAVVGRAGPIDAVKSQVRWSASRRPDGTRGILDLQGLYFYPENWDDSDMFYVDEFPQAVLLTEKVLHVLKRKKMRGYRVEPIAEFGHWLTSTL